MNPNSFSRKREGSLGDACALLVISVSLDTSGRSLP